MASVLRFFTTYAPFIFILLVVGLLFALRRLVLAQREARNSIYGLERELSQRHMSQAISALAIIGILGMAEIVLAVFLVPGLPAQSILSTPTTDLLAVPVGTLPPELLATLGALTPVPTATVATAGCIPGQIDITAPKPGDQVSGTVTLSGSANIPNFGFYYYEFALRGSDSWSTIQANGKVVQDGELGKWNTSALATGDYSLRLVVTDNLGQKLPACVVPVRVLAQGG
jgi:hypothetical protein